MPITFDIGLRAIIVDSRIKSNACTIALSIASSIVSFARIAPSSIRIIASNRHRSHRTITASSNTSHYHRFVSSSCSQRIIDRRSHSTMTDRIASHHHLIESPSHHRSHSTILVSYHRTHRTITAPYHRSHSTIIDRIAPSIVSSIDSYHRIESTSIISSSHSTIIERIAPSIVSYHHRIPPSSIVS